MTGSGGRQKSTNRAGEQRCITAEDAGKTKNPHGCYRMGVPGRKRGAFQALREANAMLVEPGHRVDGGIAIGVNFKV